MSHKQYKGFEPKWVKPRAGKQLPFDIPMGRP